MHFKERFRPSGDTLVSLAVILLSANVVWSVSWLITSWGSAVSLSIAGCPFMPDATTGISFSTVVKLLMCIISLSGRGLESRVGSVSGCLGVLLVVLGLRFVLLGAFLGVLVFDFFLDDVVGFKLDFLFWLCLLFLGVAAVCI